MAVLGHLGAGLPLVPQVPSLMRQAQRDLGECFSANSRTILVRCTALVSRVGWGHGMLAMCVLCVTVLRVASLQHASCCNDNRCK